MNLSFSIGPVRRVADDVVVHCFFQDPRAFAAQRRTVERLPIAGVRQALASGDFTGAHKSTVILYAGGASNVRRIVLLGLGRKRELTTERIRRAAAVAAREARRLKATSATIVLPPAFPTGPAALGAVYEGGALSQYVFGEYKQSTNNGRPLTSLTIHSSDRRRKGAGDRACIRTASLLAGVRLARDLANAPGNAIYPETLAGAAQAVGARHGFSVTVMDEHDIAAEGMGGVLAVGQGSARPPRFVIMEYGPADARPYVLVGKGVTFDTGGISIKPSAGMGEMKMDMAGAAAVIGTFEAVAGLRLPVRIVGLVPMVENMPGSRAQRPGDIIRHLSGKTSEVDNTDAEGRLILADALAYATRYKPLGVIDLATLTGAVVVALGHHAAGMMGNDDTLMAALRRAGDATYERVWELPMFDEYQKQIRSDVADVKNVGGRWAGPITAAMFLKQHIGPYPWVHLDIAGTAMLEENGDYTQKGGSGFGVRLLTEFLRRPPAGARKRRA